MRIVLALGGNALLRRGDPLDAALQKRRLAEAAPALARIAAGAEVVVVHGNGPQVGILATENETDPALPAPYPLADMVAESQGLIGSWIAEALIGAGVRRHVLALVTHTVVDPADPALRRPTKFIGPVMTEGAAHAAAAAHGWSVAADGDRWRRVVPSPRPRDVVEIDRIGDLLSSGACVVAGGGGGIPVTRDARGISTLDAVIDKDRAASLLARRLGADLLVILTDVPGVIAGYGTDHAKVIHGATPLQLGGLGLPAGSMGPKVEAACDFVTATGRPAVIAALDRAEAAVAGTAGTRIAPAPAPAPPRETARPPARAGGSS